MRLEWAVLACRRAWFARRSRVLSRCACYRLPRHRQRRGHVLQAQPAAPRRSTSPADVQIVLDVLRNFRQVLRVLVGNQHVAMPPRCAASSFSFKPPIGSTCTTQRDLAGHRDIGAHRNLRSAPKSSLYTCRCRHSGHPSASRLPARACACRASGGSPARSQHGRTTAHDRHRGLNGLLHDVAELAGMRQLALARNHHSFDGQQFAADFSPRKPGDLTDLICSSARP